MKLNKILTIVITAILSVFLTISAIVLIVQSGSSFYDIDTRILSTDYSSSAMITDELSDENKANIIEAMKIRYETENINEVFYDSYKIAKNNKEDTFVYAANSFVFNALFSSYLKEVTIREDETRFPVCIYDDGKYKLGDDYIFTIDQKEYKGYVSGFIHTKFAFPFMSKISRKETIIMGRNPIIVPLNVIFADTNELNSAFYGVMPKIVVNEPLEMYSLDKFYDGLDVNCITQHNLAEDSDFLIVTSTFIDFSKNILYQIIGFVLAFYFLICLTFEWKKSTKDILIHHSISTSFLLVAYIVTQIVVSKNIFFIKKTVAIAVFGTLVAINVGICLLQLSIKKLCQLKGKSLRRRFENE